MKERPEYIVVGRFGRPRGISGEIFLLPLTDNPNRLEKNGRFWIEKKGEYKRINLIAVRAMARKTAVRIEGVTEPEEAKRYTNKFLWIKSEDLGQPEAGKFYKFDLVDCRVIGEDGEDYGTIADVESYPAHDVLLIKDDAGGFYRLPMVKQFVLKVDLEKEEIIINPPEGIFDSPDEN